MIPRLRSKRGHGSSSHSSHGGQQNTIRDMLARAGAMAATTTQAVAAPSISSSQPPQTTQQPQSQFDITTTSPVQVTLIHSLRARVTPPIQQQQQGGTNGTTTTNDKKRKHSRSSNDPAKEERRKQRMLANGGQLDSSSDEGTDENDDDDEQQESDPISSKSPRTKRRKSSRSVTSKDEESSSNDEEEEEEEDEPMLPPPSSSHQLLDNETSNDGELHQLNSTITESPRSNVSPRSQGLICDESIDDLTSDSSPQVQQQQILLQHQRNIGRHVNKPAIWMAARTAPQTAIAATAATSSSSHHDFFSLTPSMPASDGEMASAEVSPAMLQHHVCSATCEHTTAAASSSNAAAAAAASSLAQAASHHQHLASPASVISSSYLSRTADILPASPSYYLDQQRLMIEEEVHQQQQQQQQATNMSIATGHEWDDEDDVGFSGVDHMYTPHIRKLNQPYEWDDSPEKEKGETEEEGDEEDEEDESRASSRSGKSKKSSRMDEEEEEEEEDEEAEEDDDDEADEDWHESSSAEDESDADAELNKETDDPVSSKVRIKRGSTMATTTAVAASSTSASEAAVPLAEGFPVSSKTEPSQVKVKRIRKGSSSNRSIASTTSSHPPHAPTKRSRASVVEEMLDESDDAASTRASIILPSSAATTAAKKIKKRTSSTASSTSHTVGNKKITSPPTPTPFPKTALPVVLNHSPHHVFDTYPSGAPEAYWKAIGVEKEKMREKEREMEREGERMKQRWEMRQIQRKDEMEQEVGSEYNDTTTTTSPDPYSVLDPSLPLSEIFARASTIPYNFSSIHACSKGWSYGEFSLYDAVLERRRVEQERVKGKEEEKKEVERIVRRNLDGRFAEEKVSPSTSTISTLLTSPHHPLSSFDPIPTPSAPLRYEKTYLDILDESRPLIHIDPRIIAAANVAGTPLPQHAIQQPHANESTEPWRRHAGKDWKHRVPAELKRAQAVYERYGMHRGSAPLAALDLTTPGALALRAKKYERAESQDVTKGAMMRRSSSLRKMGESASNGGLSPTAFLRTETVPMKDVDSSSSLLQLDSVHLARICYFLSLHDLLTTRCVSRRLHTLVSSTRSVWRDHLIHFHTMTAVTGWKRREKWYVHPTEEVETDDEVEEKAAAKKEEEEKKKAKNAVAEVKVKVENAVETKPHPKPRARKFKLRSTYLKDEPLSSLPWAESDEWFLSEQERKPEDMRVSIIGDRHIIPAKWSRVHQGWTKQTIPFIYKLRFDSENILFGPGFVPKLLSIRATLHTLEIVNNASVLNDVLLELMLLGLEKAPVVGKEKEKQQSTLGVGETIAASATTDTHMTDVTAAVSSDAPPAAASSAEPNVHYSVWLCPFPPRTRKSLPCLTSLTLHGCINIDWDRGIQFLPYYADSLLSLNLSKCTGVGNGALMHVQRGNTLVYTNLNDQHQHQHLTQPQPPLPPNPLDTLEIQSHNILGSLQKLQYMNLSGLKELLPIHAQLLDRCSYLIELDLSWCLLLDNESLIYLFRRNIGIQTRLKKLFVQGCAKLTDDFLQYALCLATQLEILDISAIGHITNQSLHAGLTPLTQLQRLVSRWNNSLTDSMCNSIIQMESLNYLDLNFCSNVSVHAKIAMKKRKKGMPLYFLTV